MRDSVRTVRRSRPFVLDAICVLPDHMHLLMTEHLIRDDADFERHVDDIHFNPVKHGWAEQAAGWPHSSLHRFIRDGLIDASWEGVGGTDINAGE